MYLWGWLNMHCTCGCSILTRTIFLRQTSWLFIYSMLYFMSMHSIRIGRCYCHERLIEPLTFIVRVHISVIRSKPGDVGSAAFLRCAATEQLVKQLMSSSLRACLPSHFEGSNWPAQMCCILFKRQKCSCHCLCAPVTEFHISTSNASNMLIYLEKDSSGSS